MSLTVCSNLKLRVKAALVSNLSEKSYFETFNPISMTEFKWVDKKRKKAKPRKSYFSNHDLNKITGYNTIKKPLKEVK